jgi:putative membrane protein
MKTFTRVLLIGLLSTAAYADDTTKKTDTATDTTKKDTAKKEKLTAAELQVIAHYHAVNLLEIDLGKAAKMKGSSQAVKEYGTMLVKDHTDADKQLKDLAKKTGQTIPAEKPATDADKQEMADTKKMAAQLKTKKGADFDKMYLQMMVDGHDKELAKIDTKVGEVQNNELAEMLRGIKPTLQHHADQARELQKNNAQASAEPAMPPAAPNKK